MVPCKITCIAEEVSFEWSQKPTFSKESMRPETVMSRLIGWGGGGGGKANIPWGRCVDILWNNTTLFDFIDRVWKVRITFHNSEFDS